MTARVEIEPDERYPFAPPQVRVLDPGCPLDFTFHIERSTSQGVPGNLCLWDSDWPVDQAPWLDAGPLLQRIAGWLQQTAAGWPDDDVCDLERYLEQNHEFLVLYDADALAPISRASVRIDRGPTPASKVVSSTRWQVRDTRRRGKAKNRKVRHLAWVDDLGEVARPVTDWATLESMLADRAVQVRQHVVTGGVNLLVLRYQRGGKRSVLALHATSSATGVELAACESADTSSATRQLRAGRLAPELATAKIAVVGCGAVGSFATDILFRSGVRNITLLDQERLRPGNVVRHLAGNHYLGWWKVDAVCACLADIDDDVDAISTRREALRTLQDAVQLVKDHRVVLDATGDGPTTSMLATAAGIVHPTAGHVVISVCVQREGDIVRVDRLPAHENDTYLPPLAAIDDRDQPRERGCGSPVSRTPPGAVIAAAELACRMITAEVSGSDFVPASIVDVRSEQPEPPFDRLGLLAQHQPPPQSA
jgi:hypothetical protein